MEEPKVDTITHLNGYLFDSLVYRYIRAREYMRDYEIQREHIDPDMARSRFDRDAMRFIEILNEVMPDHD